MTEYHWPTIRDHAIRAFRGELLNPDTEQAILETFELYPSVVVRAIDDVAEDLASGKVRSGFAVLRTRLNAAHRPAAEITIQSEDRETAIRQAERYVLNAGQHYDRWQGELHDELFGGRGRLNTWKTDDGLRDRLHRLWLEQRPHGQAVEQQQREDAERRITQRGEHARLTAEERAQKLAEANAQIQALINQQQPSTADDDIPF
jgi:hypothetical protein